MRDKRGGKLLFIRKERETVGLTLMVPGLADFFF